MPNINPNIALWPNRRAEITPERVALIYRHHADSTETWTCAELERAVRSLAGELQARGLRRGDRLAFLDFNDSRFLVAMFAAARLGAVFVPLNFRLTAAELRAILEDATPHTLIHGGEFAGIVGQAGAPTAMGLMRSARDAEDALGDVLRDGKNAEPPVLEVGPDDTALLLYTSGTTGQPKGVMLTHGNILWNSFNYMLLQGGLPGDRLLAAAPLFHTAPISTVAEAFLRGAEIHLERSFEAGRVLRLIEAAGITLMSGVPAMYQLMAQHPSFAATNLSRVRHLFVGGAPVPESLIELYASRGVRTVHRYGLTEASPLVTAQPPDGPPHKRATAGIPSIFTEIQLAGPDGGQVPQGTHGEILVRGPNVMKGYWKRAGETAETLRDGWLRTGDFGVQDADGHLTIVGRSKDMIISGGENIFPAEVESRLSEHPDVAEAAVIGVPDERWGEVPRAVVALRESAAADTDDLLEFLQPRLARYKQPKSILFVARLPRNGAGKIDKNALRARFGAAAADREGTKR